MTRKLAQVSALLLVAVFAISAISVDRLRTNVLWLSDTARDGRRAGEPGAVASAEYISEKLAETGYETQMQQFGRNRRNVVGRFGNAERTIVLGSHYDGQGSGMPSASDNASGVAVLLELARELKDDNLPVSIVVVAFDDEEQGLNGSRYFVDNSLFPLENVLAAIIFDTMGRSFLDLPSWTTFVLGSEYSPELADVVQKRMRPELFVAGTDLIGPRSDFAPFAVKKVPYLFFTNGTHRDYHGEGDTPERMDFTSLAQDTAVIAQIVRDIARLGKKPSYADPVYPATERDVLVRLLTQVSQDRGADLPQAYALMFADLQERVQQDASREAPQLAATALLAHATPRLSPFMLTLMLGPYYEGEGEKEIAAAIYEEALNYTDSEAARRSLQDKIRTLRGL